MTKIVVELFTEHPFHKRLIRELLEYEDSESGGNVSQKKLDEVDAGDSAGIVLATDKQKAFMKRLKIDFPENITKDQASKLISEKQSKE